MIIKTPDYQSAIDYINECMNDKSLSSNLHKELRLQRAGLFAEKKMAFELQSYFDVTSDLLVINNLKIVQNNVTTQIDHLLLSRKAAYFIESKSISDAISVNEYGEWIRVYRGKSTSIKSPVEQVKSQRERLYKFLRSHITELLGKVLGMQKGIASYTPHLFVAVSERGSIKGKGRSQFSEVVKKYDQICSIIKEIHSDSAGIIKFLKTDKDEDINNFSKDELNNLGQFLLKHDVAEEPLEAIKSLVEQYCQSQVTRSSNMTKETKVISDACCKHCNSSHIQIAYGRSYYIKCLDCDRNTAIKEYCSDCKQQLRIRKSKEKYYLTCKACEKETLYFVNNQ